MSEPQPRGMSVREAGRKGGQTTAARHGHEFYEGIGQQGGHKGGQTTAARYGREFYVEIGKKGGARVRELITAGKKAINQDPEQ